MPSATVVNRLHMISQNTPSRKCQAAFFTAKWANFRVHSSTMAIEIWLLMKRMATHIADIRLFLFHKKRQEHGKGLVKRNGSTRGIMRTGRRDLRVYVCWRHAFLCDAFDQKGGCSIHSDTVSYSALPCLHAVCVSGSGVDQFQRYCECDERYLGQSRHQSALNCPSNERESRKSGGEQAGPVGSSPETDQKSNPCLRR